MLRHALVSLVVLASGSAHAACEGPGLVALLTADQRAELEAQEAAIPYGQGLFWQAERGGQTITLAGTMHLSDPRNDANFAAIAPAMRAASLALFEMTAAEERQMQAALTADPTRLLIMAGPTLREQLDDETWARLATAAGAAGIPPVAAAKIQPWFLALTLSAPPCAGPELAMGSAGLDAMLMAEAAQTGPPIAALEPWDTLLTLAEAAPEDDMLDMLRLSLLPPEQQEQMFIATLEGYFDGRIGEILALSSLADDLAPGLEPARAAEINAQVEEALLYGRTESWLPVIEAEASRHDRLFVAVGAAHLPGERGLLRLLEEQGWAIRPYEG